ncbi:MAG: hypothetical protein OEY55_07665 [Acidimicrobiia bacterium]|nr:hypothetical protein [Acidimicrobiia bacterium]MDH5503007.1 hypothetical protein [Acidimicrobiia bacterium]
MIEWYWASAIGVAALIAGYLLGKQLAGRSAEPELLATRDDLAKAHDRIAAASERIKALEHDLAAAVGRADTAEAEIARLSPELAALSGSVVELRQQSADSNTARRAAEAALASMKAERQTAVDQAAIAKRAATEASDKYDAITGEFVSLKRALREALDGISRTERERDAMAAEAAAVAQRAGADVAEAERAKESAVARANAERDAALVAAEAANQRRADASTLRNEIMSAQRELAELRDELALKNRHIRELEGSSHRPPPATDPVVEAFAGFDPEAGSAVSDAEMEAAVDAALAADPALEGGDPDQDTDEDGELDPGDDDDIFTVDDLPGGDWEPDQPIPAGTGSESDTDVLAFNETGQTEPLADSGLVDVDPEPDPAPPAKTAPPSSEAETPEAETPKAETSKDNLRLIKGIGPKFETLLHARNITSFGQVAALTDDAEWETYLDTFAGRIEREQWREQAAHLLGERGN